MKMNRIYTGILLSIILLSGCKKEWEEHYGQTPETVNRNVWEALKEESGISLFVELMEEFESSSHPKVAYCQKAHFLKDKLKL